MRSVEEISQKKHIANILLLLYISQHFTAAIYYLCAFFISKQAVNPVNNLFEYEFDVIQSECRRRIEKARVARRHQLPNVTNTERHPAMAFSAVSDSGLSNSR